MSKETFEKLLPLKNELEKLCHANCNLCPFGKDIDGTKYLFVKDIYGIKYICSIMQHFQRLLDGINFLNTVAPTIIKEIYNEQKKNKEESK